MKVSSGSGAPASEAVGPISEPNPIAAFDEPALASMILRLERSSTLEHLAYRESELDELWRLLDKESRDLKADGAAAHLRAEVEAMKTMIFTVHDLVGVDCDARGAAAELRKGLFLVRKYLNRKT